MKSIKLLLLSFTLTFLTLGGITPVTAQPSLQFSHLHNDHKTASSLVTPKITSLSLNLTAEYSNSFSTGLILTNPSAVIEKRSNHSMITSNNSLDFFTSVMIFNDKLHQFISYISATSKIKEPAHTIKPSKIKVIKNKCSNDANLA